ncbi:uncharacterized protein LOC124481268 isoform X8 [Hypomesus transpacificus]|uniref:uncharacterized protein LOC124481268 isoform X8 n=1 Tax=Hypomesus transpacificus TaxID=137520 RepID=UPI001F079BBF|nr:uncharacterized protein LOC124481268 isoform X8 [Hypomesus transpacificus]
MESPTENPTRAAEYLNELNKIIETQQELLERQKNRIEDLEQQVSDLCTEKACLKEQYQRHLATCRLQQSNSHVTLGAIKENITQEKSECESSRMVRRHASLPVDVTEPRGALVSAGCQRGFPCRKWKSASFGSVDTLHQYCCPAPLFSTQLAVPAPLSECREDSALHQFCCPASGYARSSR